MGTRSAANAEGPEPGEEEAEPFQMDSILLHTFEEILANENRNVERLRFMLEIASDPDLPDEYRNTLFGSQLESVYQLHHDHILPKLSLSFERSDFEAFVGTFANFGSFFLIYQEFVRSCRGAENRIRELEDSKDDTLRSLNREWRSRKSVLTGQALVCRTLRELLVAPMQQLTRYSLLLRDLLKRIPERVPLHGLTAAAFEIVSSAVEKVNEVMKSQRIEDDIARCGHWFDVMNDHQVLLQEASVRVGVDFPQDSRVSASSYQAILFRGVILWHRKGDVFGTLYLVFSESPKKLDELSFSILTRTQNGPVGYFFKFTKDQVLSQWIRKIEKGIEKSKTHARSRGIEHPDLFPELRARYLRRLAVDKVYTRQLMKELENRRQKNTGYLPSRYSRKKLRRRAVTDSPLSPSTVIGLESLSMLAIGGEEDGGGGGGRPAFRSLFDPLPEIVSDSDDVSSSEDEEEGEDEESCPRPPPPQLSAPVARRTFLDLVGLGSFNPRKKGGKSATSKLIEEKRSLMEQAKWRSADLDPMEELSRIGRIYVDVKRKLALLHKMILVCLQDRRISEVLPDPVTINSQGLFARLKKKWRFKHVLRLQFQEVAETEFVQSCIDATIPSEEETDLSLNFKESSVHLLLEDLIHGTADENRLRESRAVRATRLCDAVTQMYSPRRDEF